jgi:hypothetical protein
MKYRPLSVDGVLSAPGAPRKGFPAAQVGIRLLRNCEVDLTGAGAVSECGNGTNNDLIPMYITII